MKIEINVVELRGKCHKGFKIGDQFVMEIGGFTENYPQGLCPHAFHSMFPAIYMLGYGGSFPWSKDKDIAYASCPARKGVVYEIKKIKD